ncbi:hypothetical protein [Saccharibacillus brassicae]|uniref:Uncharacterized protein n=1 Tax=Saccharibacillus brassicae TaxID=2583377 RepID=A0A4Y6UVP4_SACBS|nr:hypothetical protein [Saccharibacillus brassicae]QDH21783.1 hypothetical protein FFV09_13565 [Saccharibacillus brassicae]
MQHHGEEAAAGDLSANKRRVERKGSRLNVPPVQSSAGLFGRLGRAALKALPAAALLAVLGACSGGADSGSSAAVSSRTGEQVRPADADTAGAAETTRPAEDPAGQAGSSGSSDEASRPEKGGDAAASSGQATPDEGSRPVAPEAEPQSGDAAESSGQAMPAEGSRPQTERSPDSSSDGGNPVQEGSRPQTERSPDSSSDSGKSAQEGSRPQTERSPDSSSDGGKSVQEGSRPKTDSSNSPSSDKSTSRPAAEEQNRPSTKQPAANSDSAKRPPESNRTPKSSTPSTPESQRPAQAPAWTGSDSTAERSRDGSTFPGSGHYLVAQHVKPGLYRSVGQIDYWERTSGRSGIAADRIASAQPTGPAVVEIKASDVGFISTGTGIWKAVPGQKAAFHKKFGPGTYIVGTDLAPGRYKSAQGAASWAVLSGFGGEASDVLRASSVPSSAPVTIEIKKTDTGFTSRGALWIKID